MQGCEIIEAVTTDTSAARCWQSRGREIAERNVSTLRAATHICIRVGGQKPYKPARITDIFACSCGSQQQMLDHVLPRRSLHTALECISAGDKDVLRRGRVCASPAPLQLLSSGTKSRSDNNVFSRPACKSDRPAQDGVINRLLSWPENVYRQILRFGCLISVTKTSIKGPN